MSAIKTALTGYTRYRGQVGHWSFLLHRITGLGTLLFLTIHILDTATVFFFPNLYADAIALYRTTLAGLGEIVLVFCVLYHGVNGLRIAITDMYISRGWNIPAERSVARWTLIASLILWAPAAALMLRAILFYNYHLFGG